jgi:flagellar biosynthetic protein FliQ
MSSASALALLLEALKATFFAVGPVLAVALAAGVLVGLAQTVVQVNEASISFVVKAIAVTAVIGVLGPSIATQVVDYTRKSLEDVEHVVRH